MMAREGGWNLLCKFFDNMGPIPHHMHQSDEQAKLVGQQGQARGYYFPPQHNHVDNNFPYTFMGLEPGTTKDDVRRCLENWNKGDNGILDPVAGLSPQARHRLADRPGILHAPGSLVHLRAAGGQRRLRHVPVLVEGRDVALEPAGEGHARRTSTRTSTSSSSSSTGTRTSTRIRRRATACSRAGATVRARREPKAIASSGCATAPAYYSAKELTVLPGRTRHDQGRGRLRPDRHAGHGRSARSASRRPR